MSQFLSTLQMISSRLSGARIFLGAFGAILLFSVMAQAGLKPVLIGDPVPIGGGACRYNYELRLPETERLDNTATSAAANSCPGTPSTNAPCNPPGTFVTIYDIPGLIPDSVVAGALFTFSTQALGLTPSSITPQESALLTNVSFIYQGPVFLGAHTFTGFSFNSTACGSLALGNYASQDTNNTTAVSGQTVQEISAVVIPSSTNVGTTAATANVSGRVMASGGKGIYGMEVKITGASSGESKSALTDRSGYYSFSDMQVGESYIIEVINKRYTFTESIQLQTVLDDRNDINFIGSPIKQK